MLSSAPLPLYCDPFYEDRRGWLLDWLERRGAYANYYDIRIPVFPKPAWTFNDDPMTAGPDYDVLVLTRRKAWGAAPYVGDPFHYEWPVGTDNLGRHIAGDAHIVRHQRQWWEELTRG